MPKVQWDELNELVHDVKNTLCQVTKAELVLKKVKKDALRELDKLHDIILKQVNGGEK